VNDREPPRTDHVQSLERGLAVLNILGAAGRPLTIREVAEAAGLTRAAARRFLLTLARLGYVGIDRNTFSLRARVLEMGLAYLSGLSFADRAQPHMMALVDDLLETSAMAVLDDTEIVHVALCGSRRVLAIEVAVGTRFPAHATSMGRVLLAHLPEEDLEDRLERSVWGRHEHPPRKAETPETLRPMLAEVRRRGWALADEELEEGVRSIAVPVRDATGTPVAAMNVATVAARATVDDLVERFLPRLQTAVEALEADLRGEGASPPALRAS
jgi:IclR family pca regulon transcriptional regulator